MENILTVNDLAVRLEGKTLINDISFTLGRGESLAVIGPNGAGKTLLLRTLLGLLPHEGKIMWVPGVRMGYVPQKIDLDRHIPLNAMDLFVAKCRVLNIPESQIAEKMEKVGIGADIAQTPVGHLSGGGLQKVLVALALLGNPAVIFLDEPTASLDEPSEERVYTLLRRLEKENIAIVVVEHDLDMARNYMDKVLCLNVKGICYGVPKEVLTAQTLETLYGPQEDHGHRS